MGGAARYNGLGFLLCASERHIAPVPRISGRGVTGDLVCEECGEPMILIDAIILDRKPTVASVEGGFPRWDRHWYEAGAVLRDFAAARALGIDHYYTRA